jgi:hypothetical protein
MSPSNRVVRLYRQAPAPLYVSFYDSQGYGGGILTRLYKGIADSYLHFFPFGATAHIWALAYLHETFRFTSVY